MQLAFQGELLNHRVVHYIAQIYSQSIKTMTVGTTPIAKESA